MTAQRQDVGGFTPLEKTEQTNSNLLYLYIVNTALHFHVLHTFTQFPFPHLLMPLVTGYTRVVEWVLGRPAEL